MTDCIAFHTRSKQPIQEDIHTLCGRLDAVRTLRRMSSAASDEEWIDSELRAISDTCGYHGSVCAVKTGFYDMLVLHGYSEIARRWTAYVDVAETKKVLIPVKVLVSWVFVVVDIPRRVVTCHLPRGYDRACADVARRIASYMSYKIVAEETARRCMTRDVDTVFGEWSYDVRHF